MFDEIKFAYPIFLLNKKFLYYLSSSFDSIAVV